MKMKKVKFTAPEGRGRTIFVRGLPGAGLAVKCTILLWMLWSRRPGVIRALEMVWLTLCYFARVVVVPRRNTAGKSVV